MSDRPDPHPETQAKSDQDRSEARPGPDASQEPAAPIYLHLPPARNAGPGDGLDRGPDAVSLSGLPPIELFPRPALPAARTRQTGPSPPSPPPPPAGFMLGVRIVLCGIMVGYAYWATQPGSDERSNFIYIILYIFSISYILIFFLKYHAETIEKGGEAGCLDALGFLVGLAGIVYGIYQTLLQDRSLLAVTLYAAVIIVVRAAYRAIVAAAGEAEPRQQAAPVRQPPAFTDEEKRRILDRLKRGEADLDLLAEEYECTPRQIFQVFLDAHRQGQVGSR